MPALRKQIIEMPAMDGLQQKTTAQRLSPGQSAKAVNLNKNKQGRLEKRPGLIPLTMSDPFGSGFSMSTGIQLGTWSDGTGPDNLIAIGRGARPGVGTNSAGVLQMYSDELGGPKINGYGPELTVTSDNATAGSQGTSFSPCQATIGDFCVQAWIDPAYNFAAGYGSGLDPSVVAPLPPCGPVYWSAIQVSTGQTVIPPSILDTTNLYAQCVRIAVVGFTFIICYSAASTPSSHTNNNGFIYGRTATLTALTTGGQFSPAPTSAPITVVNGVNAAVINPYGQNPGPTVGFFTTNNWAMPGGYFDMQAALSDTQNFVLAYATGTFTPAEQGGQWVGTNIVVDKRAVAAPGTLITQWAVESIPGTVHAVGGFGVRADASLSQVAVAWAFWDSGVSSTQLKAAIGNYPAMTGLNTSTIIYRAFDGNETAPSWLSVNYCSASSAYVVSCSPMASCWNAAFSTSTALGTVGVGAQAHVSSIDGFVTSVYIIENSTGNFETFNSTTPSVTISSADGKGSGATVNAVLNTSDGSPAANFFIGGINVNAAGSGYDKPPIATFQYQGSFGPGFQQAPVLGTTILGNIDVTTGSNPSKQIVIDQPGSGYNGSLAPQVTFGMGGAGTGAVLVATVTAGAITSVTVSNGGSGYDPNNPPVLTVVDTKAGYQGSYTAGSPGTGAVLTPVISAGAIASVTVVNGGRNYSSTGSANTKIYVSGGAIGTAIISNGQITGIQITQQGVNYPSPPSITITSPQATTPLYQSSTNRLNGIAGFTGTTTGTSSTQLWYPSNNARIIQNMIKAAGSGSPVTAVQYLCGGTGIGQYPINTSGVTLASNGLEANGVIYYLGWVPSLTQGSFVVLAFDLACATNVSGANGMNGNIFPMRPVGILQKMTALADPGWGFQLAPTGSVYTFLPGLNIQSVQGPNCWTGGSGWGVSGDHYGSASVSYVTSSQGARLSPAQGIIQTTPGQGFYTAKFGNLTAICGGLPSLFDGQNVFEQGFIYSPEGILASLYKDSGTVQIPGGITWSSATDSYTWIFTWEQFDAQGNFHQSNRAAITVTGQDILDAYGPGTIPNSIPSLPYTGGIEFRIPNLGVTNRQWPTPFAGPGQPSWFGSDLRAYAQPPSCPVTLGVYRTTVNESTFYRLYDRFYNGDDIGSNGFSLGPTITNSFYTGPSGGAVGQVCCCVYADGLADKYIEDPANTFPLLYGDGTNGNPGSLDNYSPPASPVICRHQERIFIANGNLVLFTKQRTELVGPGYNTTVNSFYVGGDDPVTGLASMDDKLIVFKQNQLYYVTGSGPADDGSGSNFSDAQMIPTDAGCISPGSIISTPEGVYFQSDAGLRLVTRSLSVEYVGGPVEDEIGLFPLVTGAVLYPSNNKVFFLVNQTDYTINPLFPQFTTGEVLVRDYVLDAWTVSQYKNILDGFISAAVAFTNGSQGTWTNAPGYAYHAISSTGQIVRERSHNDTVAYYDDKGGTQTYIQGLWVCAPIKMQDLARFRAWDIQVWGVSTSPHGLVISTAIDFGATDLSNPNALRKTYPWSIIAPGGSTPLPLTQIRSYDGRMAEAFQVSVTDISDPSSTNGQGFQVLGLSVTTGAYPSQYKLPPGSTQ